MFNRKRLIKRLVEIIVNNESFSIKLLEAIRMSDKVWKCVIKQTILNFFVKVDFKDHYNYNTIDISNIPDDKWIFVADYLSLDDDIFLHYVEMDIIVYVYGKLTDNEI